MKDWLERAHVRRILKAIGSYGRFVNAQNHVYEGAIIRGIDENGLLRNMYPGTARVYLRRLRRMGATRLVELRRTA